MQTVLVVDDDDSVRTMLQVILELEGFTVHVAASGHEALTIATHEVVDLVTIDLGLPDMTGLELAAQLRSLPNASHSRHMIVSGHPLTAESRAQADAVLNKPFDFTSFTDVLRHMLARPPVRLASDATAAELDRILTYRLIEPAFQPIVDLTTFEVVGVEGLARGPVGSPLHMPNALFGAAHARGRLHELDALCRYAAIAAARDHGAGTPPLVFVNVEPGTTELPMSAELQALLYSDLPFQVVVEFTERALTRRLPALVRHASDIRGRGNVVALDDLGLDPRAVALLPLLQPEIVKLDMSLVQGRLTEASATVAAAVSAYAERSGAWVIAEGIETQEHLTTALALGAHWGQGWLFARPGPLSALAELPVSATRPASPQRQTAVGGDLRSPFALATVVKTPRQGTVDVINGISRQMESQARALGDLAVLLVSFQDIDYSDLVSRRYEDLAIRAAVVGLLGAGISNEPFPGAHGAALAPGDVLLDERVILVLGPYEASLLCARQRHGDVPDALRRYDFVVSHDRELVETIARLLMGRFTPRDSMTRTTALFTTQV